MEIKIIRNSIITLVLAGLAALSTGCAHEPNYSGVPATDYSIWYGEVKNKLTPQWRRAMQSYFRKKTIEDAKKVVDSLHPLKISALVKADGTVSGVRIMSSTGIRSLDSACANTFRQASPIPKPPTSIEHNGVARLDWNFVIQK